ncbi:serine-rich adhesin for platelets-like [Pyrus x bretschneideri]|uniref:serine-rich adhesin for platelets-like n=1 Tax=Pyrus x bretschneideri TaxID=225117 RepID=UPI00202EFC61|nr:serine-rich adhesin for platelets-like [Pyrus x bretschneideri]
MSVGAETLLVCVWRLLKLSMKTSSLCVRRHPFISATLLFFYLFYVFFKIFVFWFPFLVCIVVLVRLFYTSGGLTILEEAKRDEKRSTNDQVSCKKPDHPVGGDGVVNRDGCTLMRQKSRRTNVSRRCIEASGQDYYNVGKGISISKTPKDGLIGGTALIDRSKKAVMEEKMKCAFDKGESSTVKASAEENIQALVKQHHSVLESDISESQLLSSDDSDEQPDKSKGGGTNGEETQEDGNKAVQWTDDDQRNLMDLGFSEMERNKRLESLIARRRARKLFKMQVEKGLLDLDTIIPGQIAPIFVEKNTPFDYAKLFSSSLDTPGSAPSILLPMQNPFDLPYDPHEEKPNLMVDSFQQEFTTVHQKEMLFCRHESFSSGAASYPLEPKRKSLDGLGFSGFKKPSETGAHDRHIERILSGKHDEVIEALLSKARNNMSDIGSNADTAESRTESHLIESPIPAISSVKPKDEGKSETQRVTDTKATNKMESRSVEMESRADDSNDESSSTSYSEDDEQSSHSTRPGPSQNAGSKVRHFPPKPLSCSIPMSKSVKELLYDSSPSANKRSGLEERLFYSERGTCHTPTYSIASDLQVEVSEAGSPSLTDNTANSPSDKESETLDGNFEKEYVWTASSQSSRTEENESKLWDACGLSEKYLASIRFSGNNKNIKDSSESSSMHMQHLDELDDVCSLSSSITDLHGDIQTHSMGYDGNSYDDVRQAVEKVGKLRTSSSCTVLSLENQDETTKSNENLVTHSSAKPEESLNPLDKTTKKVNTPAINATNLKDERTNADRDGGDQILIKQETRGESSKPKEVTILASSRHSEEIFANSDKRDVSLDTKQLIKDNKNSNYTEGNFQQEIENEDEKELDAKTNSNPIQGRKDDQRTAESRVYSDRIPSVVQKDLVNEDVVVESNYLSSSSSLTSVLLEDIPRDQTSSSNSNPERHIGVSESKVGGKVKSDSSTMKPHDSTFLTPQTAVQPVEESTSDCSNTSYSKKSQEQCKPTEKSEEANIILTEQAEEIGDLSQKTRETASELKKQAAEIEKISGKAKEAAAELKKPTEEKGNFSQQATETILELKKSAEEIESMSQKAREVAVEMKIPAEEIVNVSKKAAETVELKKAAEEIEGVSQKATQPTVEPKKLIEEIESATQKATVASTKLIKPGEAIKEVPEKTTKVDAELKQSVKAASNVSQKATETAARSKIPIEKIEDASAKTTNVEAEITKPAEQTGNISQKTIEAASELKNQGDEIGSVSRKEVEATAKVEKPAEEIGSVLCKATEAPVVLKIPSEEVGIISQKASEAPAILKHLSEEIENVSQKASKTPTELKKPAEEIESVSQKASKAATESGDLSKKVENVPRKKIEIVAELKSPAEENGNVSIGVAVEVEKPVKVGSESQRATEATVELKKSPEEVGSASQKETEARVASKKSSEEIESGSQKMIEAPEKIKHPVEELGNVLQQATMAGLELPPAKETENLPQKASEVAAESKKTSRKF